MRKKKDSEEIVITKPPTITILISIFYFITGLFFLWLTIVYLYIFHFNLKVITISTIIQLLITIFFVVLSIVLWKKKNWARISVITLSSIYAILCLSWFLYLKFGFLFIFKIMNKNPLSILFDLFILSIHSLVVFNLKGILLSFWPLFLAIPHLLIIAYLLLNKKAKKFFRK